MTSLKSKQKTKRSTRNLVKTSRRPSISRGRKWSNIGIVFEPAPALLKRILFQIEAPQAECVKLAADFTAWDGLPLEMIKERSGTWAATVPLSPGEYAYRFIVDGDWADDPSAQAMVANPFGTFNALKEVTK